MSRRSFVRLISFLTAGLIAFAIMSCVYYWQNMQAKRQLEYGYLRSLENLSLSMENIKNTLHKGLYSNSPQMMNDLSGKLASDASAAKISMSQLPVYELNLENTNRFLSQVGNYSQSLAKRFADGETLTEEDRNNIYLLYEYAIALSNELWDIESMIAGGHLTFERVIGAVSGAGTGQSPAHITDGFANVEGGFDNYPTLIYDGPFSDHIMQQEPMMTKGQKSIDQAQAHRIAEEVTGLNNLHFVTEEAGRLPAYNFSEGNTTLSITKQGGYFVYMLNYRQIQEKTISTDKAISLAQDFLKKLGYTSLDNTYYELNGGVCTVNFAGVQNDVTVYTDLIKVGVALDNGEIMSYDARGFITAHHQRDIKAPKISADEARDKLSEHLTVKSSKLCIIPSGGLNERYCYEFLCITKNGQQILVYVNADTGKEEQILLLMINENGALTV